MSKKYSFLKNLLNNYYIKVIILIVIFCAIFLVIYILIHKYRTVKDKNDVNVSWADVYNLSKNKKHNIMDLYKKIDTNKDGKIEINELLRKIWNKKTPSLCYYRSIPNWANPLHNPYKRAFKNYNIPQNVNISEFNLRVLSPYDIDEDYKNIEERKNQELLFGLFGDKWPKFVSREDDLDDLCWHYNSFLEKRSFSWIIRYNNEYVGCAYYFPILLPKTVITNAQVFVWFSHKYNNQLKMTEFYRNFLKWVSGDQFPKLKIKFFTPQNRQ